MSEIADLQQKQAQEARELREKQAKESREAREKKAEENRKKKDARVAEIQKNQPQPGEPGHYSPPVKEAVVHQTQGEEVPEEEPPPGMSPEEQPVALATAPSTATGTEGSSGTTTEETDYDSMTVAELKDLAHKRGVEIHSDMLKDDIIKALKNADKAG